eukprot:8158725-Heterocapsa_arctica.AAC.1
MWEFLSRVELEGPSPWPFWLKLDPRFFVLPWVCLLVDIPPVRRGPRLLFSLRAGDLFYFGYYAPGCP